MSCRVSNIYISALNPAAIFPVMTGGHSSFSTSSVVAGDYIMRDTRKQKGWARHGALHRITTGRTIVLLHEGGACIITNHDFFSLLLESVLDLILDLNV